MAQSIQLGRTMLQPACHVGWLQMESCYRKKPAALGKGNLKLEDFEAFKAQRGRRHLRTVLGSFSLAWAWWEPQGWFGSCWVEGWQEGGQGKKGCPESPPSTKLGRGRKRERNKGSINCLWLQESMLVMIITVLRKKGVFKKCSKDTVCQD